MRRLFVFMAAVCALLACNAVDSTDYASLGLLGDGVVPTERGARGQYPSHPHTSRSASSFSPGEPRAACDRELRSCPDLANRRI